MGNRDVSRDDVASPEEDGKVEDEEENEDEEDDEDEGSEESVSISDTSLDEFAPCFSMSTGSELVADVEKQQRALAVLSVPIDIGIGRILQIRDIAQEHQSSLKWLFEDWVANAGPENAREIVVCFN